MVHQAPSDLFCSLRQERLYDRSTMFLPLSHWRMLAISCSLEG